VQRRINTRSASPIARALYLSNDVIARAWPEGRARSPRGYPRPPARDPRGREVRLRGGNMLPPWAAESLPGGPGRGRRPPARILADFAWRRL